MLIRNKYINKIKPFIGKQVIKVLTGQRRVGKSTIMRQIIHAIKEDDKNANIIYIDKELNEYKDILTNEDLYNFINAAILQKKTNYAFIDEIQEISNFEIALRQLLAKGIDIYCTGSNAKMLSGDLATHLSGRYIEIHVHPLSYTEFLDIHKLDDSNEALNKYIRYGGLPYLCNLPFDDEIMYGYLKSIFNTIILKDIVSRYSIRDIDFLQRLVEYLSDNLGNYTSSNKVSDFLKSQKVSISVNTVMNYLNYLTNSFFIQKVQRFDIIGKKRFEVNDKFYFADLGLKHSIIPYDGNQISGIFENLVYSKLKHEDYEVFIGKHHEREIDFVAKKGSDTKYVQVAYQLPDDKVRKREFGNLLKIEDNYEKIVVSADEFAENYRGVKHFHIRKFLTTPI